LKGRNDRSKPAGSEHLHILIHGFQVVGLLNVVLASEKVRIGDGVDLAWQRWSYNAVYMRAATKRETKGVEGAARKVGGIVRASPGRFSNQVAKIGNSGV
jgi:hypothetical protein